MPEIVVKQLACGMPLICERMDGVKSVGVSWLLPFGAVHDPVQHLGMSAMCSHLLFRGAGIHDARAQADAFDTLGMGRGADTQTFRLSISATLLGSNLLEALPLLVEAVRAPRFEQPAIDAVRDLCVQSIEGLDDDPQTKVMLNLRERHAAAPINRSGMGTIEGIESITRDSLVDAWETLATPGGSVLAIAGDVDAERTADELNGLLEGWTGQTPDPEPEKHAERGSTHEEQDTSQVHIALAHDAPAESDPDAALERVVVSALSGGMSGRLFTEVREKRSLCYSVNASFGADRAFGRVAAYVGTTPERAQEALDVLWSELTRINGPKRGDGPTGPMGGGITQSEFDRAIIGMTSRLVMSGESSSARAGALAQDFRKIGRPRSLEERVGVIKALTLKEVNDYLFRRRMGTCTVATIGPSPLTAPKDLLG
jgi:predicted Zn-dependent peptidase